MAKRETALQRTKRELANLQALHDIELDRAKDMREKLAENRQRENEIKKQLYKLQQQGNQLHMVRDALHVPRETPIEAVIKLIQSYVTIAKIRSLQ